MFNIRNTVINILGIGCHEANVIPIQELFVDVKFQTLPSLTDDTNFFIHSQGMTSDLYFIL